MNNYQWLLQMDGAERKAWFDAEHVEHQERALDGDTEPENDDSRERLEAEIESYSAFDIMDTITLDMVIGWIDRQAAITEREVCAWIRGKDAEHDERIHRVAELQQRVDELTAERDELQRMVDGQREVIRRYQDSDCGKLIAERERYREKFGKCIDYADAIHALMDEGMA